MSSNDDNGNNDPLLWLIEFAVALVMIAVDVSMGLVYICFAIGWNILFGGE